MAEYTSVFYKNSFLDHVIVRIDFLQFVQTESTFCESIEKEILRIFPKRGKDQIIRFNTFNVASEQNENGIPNANVNENRMVREGIQREYLANDSNNKLTLSNKFMIFEIEKYLSFDKHRQWFVPIVSSFFQKNKISANRTGIRYINSFDQSRVKLQKKFFVPEIASSLHTKLVVSDEEPQMIRSMHISEYRIDEMTMNFRYGMFNPEYPNSMRKNDFILDFDFFTNEVIESTDGIIRVLDKGHQEIQAMFEKSITDSLRKVMGNE